MVLGRPKLRALPSKASASSSDEEDRWRFMRPRSASSSAVVVCSPEGAVAAAGDGGTDCVCEGEDDHDPGVKSGWLNGGFDKDGDDDVLPEDLKKRWKDDKREG